MNVSAHYLGGRSCNAATRDAGKVAHALTKNAVEWEGAALCGAKPGKHSYGWTKAPFVTCPRCLSALPNNVTFDSASAKPLS